MSFDIRLPTLPDAVSGCRHKEPAQIPPYGPPLGSIASAIVPCEMKANELHLSRRMNGAEKQSPLSLAATDVDITFGISSICVIGTAADLSLRKEDMVAVVVV